MDDDDKAIEIAMEKHIKAFKASRSHRYPTDRMNYAYDHWPMGQKGSMDGAKFLLNAMEAELGDKQWEQAPCIDRYRRKTKQNPNHKALEE